ncbi:hypothetical protein chiPu_0012177 [Chiloscyllium punctatum]|uniref:Immunoglobulin V-set domain-containing protein n=1 Tax=Chiloscyllium punctatum TaxID=137246 RepID=A0A401STH3_CHIPU|nr:hypothetical protein [Chiloscyllium punctatum]
MHLTRCLACVLLLLCVAGSRVQQSPFAISKSAHASLEIRCSAEGSFSSEFYWYRQLPNGELLLLFYSPNAEKIDPTGKVEGFTASRPDDSTFYLQPTNLQGNHTGFYYCAWRLHSDTRNKISTTKIQRSEELN